MKLSNNMRVSNKFKPYTKGKPTFKLRGRPGVYIIFDNKAVRYVGYSAHDVYKTMYRHFQRWQDKAQQRVTYSPTNNNLTARVIYTNTAAQALKLETAARIKYNPTDNPQKIADFEATPQENAIFDKANNIKYYEGPIPF